MKAKILDPKLFQWIKPESTDIVKRFENLGWIAPSKNPYIISKWKKYKLT